MQSVRYTTDFQKHMFALMQYDRLCLLAPSASLTSSIHEVQHWEKVSRDGNPESTCQAILDRSS